MKKGSKITLEQRRRLSESHKGQISYMKWKHHSEETKRKISEANKGNTFWLGRRHSEKSKRKYIWQVGRIDDLGSLTFE